MGKIGIGIIGCGAIARRAHLSAWKKNLTCQVMAVSDLDQNLANKVKSEFDIPYSFKEYEKILEREDIQIIDICTPTPTHYDIIMDAISAGKYILVEKPLTTSLEQTKKIYKYVREKNAKLCLIYNYRYFPVVQQTEKIIKSKSFGKNVSFQASALSKFPVAWTRSKWLYHKGGVLFDFSPHLIDLILWFNKSKPVRVFAMGNDVMEGNMNFINYANVLIEFEDNSLAFSDLSWVTGTSNFKFQLHGTAGHIELDVKNNYFFEYYGTFTPLDNLALFGTQMKSLFKGIYNRSFFRGAVVHYESLFKDCLNSLNSNTSPPITVEDGLWVDLVLNAAQMSIEEKRDINLNQLITDIL